MEGKGWQPIETAPRDGTGVDIWADGQRWPNRHWYAQHEAWAYHGWHIPRTGINRQPYRKTIIQKGLEPTHWMPLPSPPGEAASPAESPREESRETIETLQAEVQRPNAALKYEEGRSDRIGTHGPGCWAWGPRHYECLVAELEKLAHGTSSTDHP